VLLLIECSMNFGIMARMAAADCLQAKGYEVVAVDLPPYGFSDKSYRTNQSVTAQADSLFILFNLNSLAGNGLWPGIRWAGRWCGPLPCFILKRLRV
jgi:pimeloyl-ACP methyl ester carboxylesterase